MLKAILLAIVSATGWPAGALAAELPAEAVALHAAHIGRVQPAVRSWIDEQAKALRQASPGAVSDAALRANIGSRFAGQTLTDTDVETMAMLVMTQAAKDAEAEIKELLAHMKAVNDAKQKLREAATKAKKQAADLAAKRGSDRCVPPSCGGLELSATATALRAAPGRLNLTAREPATVDQLRAVADELKTKLDSMNEMSEMTSLRLQMMMDRRSKFISTLSNIMKKISATQDTLVQNLK